MNGVQTTADGGPIPTFDMLPIDDDSDLRRLQVWMQSVISHPRGISAGIRSDQAREQLDVEVDQIENVVTRSSKLSAEKRLEVYGNAYFARLVGCLEEEFPATQHAVGESAFTGFVIGYLQKYPSTSYSLGELHRRFPQFLEESRPAGDARPAGQTTTPDWIDFVIDLATLETLYCDVFDGPGEEHLALLSPEKLSHIPPERWMSARLITAESLRLLVVRFPVHEYASAVRKGEPATLPSANETRLAVHRRNFVVRRRPLTARQFELLRALQEGQSVSEAIARSLAAAGVVPSALDDEEFAALSRQMQADFREWASEGYFRDVVT